MEQEMIHYSSPLISSPLISAAEFKTLQRTAAQDLVVLDGSWHLPTANRDARMEFTNERIPGARFFDIDVFSDPESTLPHMLPSAEVFQNGARDMGVTARSHVVVYDTVGLHSAARVWWMFRVFGHANVQVLDGGLPAWRMAGGDVISGDESSREDVPLPGATNQSDNAFVAELDRQRVAAKADVQQASTDSDVLILDARSRARFNGEAPEPRKGLASGHIPGSTSLPFQELLDNGHLRSRAELEPLLNAIGIDAEHIKSNKQTVVTTCGSGVTAAIITLALEVAGYGLQRLYDGSWSEWGLQT